MLVLPRAYHFSKKPFCTFPSLLLASNVLIMATQFNNRFCNFDGKACHPDIGNYGIALSTRRIVPAPPAKIKLLLAPQMRPPLVGVLWARKHWGRDQCLKDLSGRQIHQPNKKLKIHIYCYTYCWLEFRMGHISVSCAHVSCKGDNMRSARPIPFPTHGTTPGRTHFWAQHAAMQKKLNNQTNRITRIARTFRTGRTRRTGRTGRAGRTGRTGRTGQAGRTNRTGRTSLTRQTGRIGRKKLDHDAGLVLCVL